MANSSSVEYVSEGEMHTLVDRMLAYIQERGKTTVAELSETFAISHEQVEKLATVLEDSGLVSMRYALIHPGRTELISLHKPPATLDKRAGTSSEPKAMHDSEVRDMMRDVDLELQDAQQQLNNIEQDVINRLVKINSTLSVIERDEKTAKPGDIDYLVREAEALESIRKAMSSRLRVFESRLEEVGRRIRAVKHAVRIGPLHRLLSIIRLPSFRRPAAPAKAEPEPKPMPKRAETAKRLEVLKPVHSKHAEIPNPTIQPLVQAEPEPKPKHAEIPKPTTYIPVQAAPEQKPLAPRKKAEPPKGAPELEQVGEEPKLPAIEPEEGPTKAMEKPARKEEEGERKAGRPGKPKKASPLPEPASIPQPTASRPQGPRAGSSLVECVRNNLSAGYTAKQIQDALEDEGWSKANINDAFKRAQIPQPTASQSQGLQAGVEYVRNNLSAGYTAKQIQDALEDEGWPKEDIHDALKLAQEKVKKGPLESISGALKLPFGRRKPK